jgi:hypothetical protein
VHGSSQLGIEAICTWTSVFRIESSKVVERIALDCEKLTNENTANTDALKEMDRLRTLAKLNENFKFCNF